MRITPVLSRETQIFEALGLLQKKVIALSPQSASRDWDELQKNFTLQDHEPLETLQEHSTPVTRLGFVVSGVFKISCSNSKKQEFIKAFRSRGEFIGAYSDWLLNRPTRLMISCIKGGSIVWVQTHFLKSLESHHLDFEILFRKIAEASYIEKENRENQLLTLDAAERFSEFKIHHPELLRTISQNDIAKFLGITPVALSRIRNFGKTSAPKELKSLNN